MAPARAEPLSLTFRSALAAPAPRIWDWIVSVDGISREMWPWFRMTAPRGVRSLADIDLEPGKPLFRSHIFLFGVLPFGHSDMTLVEIDEGRGFVERSPMSAMTVWRHERRIDPLPADPAISLLTDRLSFAPRPDLAPSRAITRWFIRRTFTHRHEVLRAHLSGIAPQDAPETGDAA